MGISEPIVTPEIERDCKGIMRVSNRHESQSLDQYYCDLLLLLFVHMGNVDPLIVTPLLTGDSDRDPNFKDLSRRGFINHESTLGSVSIGTPAAAPSMLRNPDDPRYPESTS